MARPKGSLNKRAKQLLDRLESTHKFFLLPKIIKLYNDTDKLYSGMLDKVLANMDAGVSPTTDMNEEEVKLFNQSRKDMWSILSRLLSYCYPKLRSLDVGVTETDNVTFNINIPGAELTKFKD